MTDEEITKMLTDKFGDAVLFLDGLKNAKCCWNFSTTEQNSIVLYRHGLEDDESAFHFLEFGEHEVTLNGKDCNNDSRCLLDDDGNPTFFTLETIMEIFSLNNIEQNE